MSTPGIRTMDDVARCLSALALATACVGLTSCSLDDNPQPTPPVTTSTAPTSTPTPVPTSEPPPAQEPAPDPPGDAMSEIPIRIVIADQTLDARLWDNPAAQSLLDQLPLTLDFSDYGRQEVLAEPPEPLTMEGMPSGESAPAGTIGYFAPGRVIVLYYTDVGRYDGIVRIGQIDGDISLLQNWNDSRSVTIERAE